MTTITARHWTRPKEFLGAATKSDFILWEEQLHVDELKDEGLEMIYICFLDILFLF